MSLTAVDPTGHEPSGWPIKLNFAPVDSSGYAPSDVEVGPDGTIYVTAADTIEAFHPDGKPVTGWPYRASRIPYPAWVAAMLPVAQGIYTNINAGELVLLGKNGAPVPGWPVSLSDASADGASPGQLIAGSDGTLYVEDVTTDTIYAYGPDGAPRPGWPLHGWSSMTFDTSGRIYVWKHRFAVSGARYSGPAIETQIGAVDAAGRFYPGWPVKLDGPASSPTFGPDGTVYMTRGTSYGPGSQGSSPSATILALDRAGNARPGWPRSLPTGYWVLGSLPAVAQAASDPPVVAADGSVYVIAASGNSTGLGSTAVFALQPGGGPMPGWPRSIGMGQLSNVFADPVGSGWLTAGSGIYLISDKRVLKLQTDGTLAPGWPIGRPCGAAPVAVEQMPDGGVLVLWNAGDKPSGGVLEVRYRPDGSVAAG
jgi:hypothetical protein